jgi:leucyl aminopeptidase (aminopeptidase T)
VPDFDPDAAEKARIAAGVLRRSLGVRPGENVVVETWTEALPWADAFVLETRRIGAHPLVIYESEPAFWDSVRRGVPRAMNSVGAHELAAVETTDAWVYMPGPNDRARLHDAPAPVRRVLDRWDEQWFRAARERGLRACRLEFTSTDEAAARFYGIDLQEWRRELIEGSRIDPKTFHREARNLVRRLRSGRRLSIQHPSGTRLDLGLQDRPVTVQDGRIDAADLQAGRTMAVLPGGAAFVALDERVAEGIYLSNRPSTHNRGTFRGARWTFHDGRLVEYEIGEGAEVFDSAHREAGRERDRPALLEIGLNPKIRNAPIWEDYQRGVVTVYVGRNDDFGGRTRGSYRDFALLEGADVSVDGHEIVRGGELV